MRGRTPIVVYILIAVLFIAGAVVAMQDAINNRHDDLGSPMDSVSEIVMVESGD